jgi:hypothetical protein
MMFFFLQLTPNWNSLLFMECFHCNVVFRRDQTIYSICEYFVVNDVSINFKPNQIIFPFWNFLFNNHQDFY